MNFEGNPFTWGFVEQRSLETLAKRAKATYNKPAETVEQRTALENFFGNEFATSANPAFITGTTAIEPSPYVQSSSDESSDGAE